MRDVRTVADRVSDVVLRTTQHVGDITAVVKIADDRLVEVRHNPNGSSGRYEAGFFWDPRPNTLRLRAGIDAGSKQDAQWRLRGQESCREVDGEPCMGVAQFANWRCIMDPSRFDDFVREVATSQSRRSLLKRISAAAAAGVAGSFGLARRGLAADACPSGTYGDGTVCTPCPTGTYSDSTGQISCTVCPTGTYNNLTGQDACMACPTGTYSDSTGQISCADCPTGTYNNLTGQDACMACPTGTYSDSIGQISCADCPTGTYNNLTGQDACMACQVGTYSDSTGQISCADCPTGTYNNLTGQDACMACQVGTYSDSIGQISCTVCPTGTSNDVPGSTSCPVCASGFYRSGSGDCIALGMCVVDDDCPGAQQVCCGPETDKPGKCVGHGKDGGDRACYTGRKGSRAVSGG